jgi:hypothetical protein
LHYLPSSHYLHFLFLQDHIIRKKIRNILQPVQPLLCNMLINNGVMQPVSRQRIDKHVPAAINTHTTIELLSETVFSTRSVQSGYKKDNWGDPVRECQTFRVEAGSNTSTVTLRVVGGDEKGSLKSETVKYGRKSQGTRARERLPWQGPAAYTKDRPVLSSERAPHKSKTVMVK